MMIWTLEVEDVGCPVDDMGKMDVFTFLCFRVREDGVVGGRTRVQAVDSWIPARGLGLMQVTT